VRQQAAASIFRQGGRGASNQGKNSFEISRLPRYSICLDTQGRGSSMQTQSVVELVVAGVIVGLGGWYVVRAFLTWRRLRGDRIVTCPETGQPAAVRLDVSRAISTIRRGPVTLESCSRWNERDACDQACVEEAGHSDRSAVAIVRRWAGDRACAMCGAALISSESAATGHHVALLDPAGGTREWTSIESENLPVALATCLPVCWNCHIAETFRRMHPELVTERDGQVVHVAK
jgi:hypothetical protein